MIKTDLRVSNEVPGQIVESLTKIFLLFYPTDKVLISICAWRASIYYPDQAPERKYAMFSSSLRTCGTLVYDEDVRKLVL